MDENGTRTLPNGAIADRKTGRIIKAAPGSAFTPETGAKARAKRREALQEATREGALRAAREGRHKDLKDFIEAHTEVVTDLMRDIVLNDEEKGKVRADVYKMILEMEGTITLRDKSLMVAGAGGNIIHLEVSDDTMQYMLDQTARYFAKQEGQIIDGEYSIDPDGS